MARARTSLATENPPPLEPVARRRLWDDKRAQYSVRVLPGETYTTGDASEVVVTVLGSCIAACMRNPRNGFGGLNHFMLPESDTGDWNGVSAALRYGNYAMEALINEILKSGCDRRDLRSSCSAAQSWAKAARRSGRRTSRSSSDTSAPKA
jgi:chemotaxis protein CheD